MELDGLQAFTEQLRTLPFVRGIRLWRPKAEADGGFDGTATIKTATKSFHFVIVVKKSYLDHSSTNLLIATAEWKRKQERRELLLLARYVPTPTGERLIEHGISFVDLAGNIHLSLGNNHYRTILGKKESQKVQPAKRLGPTRVQFLFAVTAYPESAAWSVRQLAVAAGISKSQAAELRRDLVDAGLLDERSRRFHFRSVEQQKDQLLTGYGQVLRPKLFISRFRSADQDPRDLVKRLRSLGRRQVRFSLTGGPAAELLQHFYRGNETPLFLEGATPALWNPLRLLPDKTGPVILLRPFGSLAFWKNIEDVPIAHPWLIYAELMQSDDPRAHEAAEELRKGFLVE